VRDKYRNRKLHDQIRKEDLLNCGSELGPEVKLDDLSREKLNWSQDLTRERLDWSQDLTRERLDWSQDLTREKLDGARNLFRL